MSLYRTTYLLMTLNDFDAI